MTASETMTAMPIGDRIVLTTLPFPSLMSFLRPFMFASSNWAQRGPGLLRMHIFFPKHNPKKGIPWTH